MVPFVETDLIMGDEGQHLKRGAVNEAEETDDETRRLPVSKKKSFRKAGTELVQFDVQQQQSFDHSNQQQNVTAWAPLLSSSNPWSASPPESIGSVPMNDLDQAASSALPPSPPQSPS